MINNFDLITPILSFSDTETEQGYFDDFYFIQILKRKKEHPELGSNSYVVKTYFINSLDGLEFHKPEMMCLADFHNARVYISLNKRSYEQMAFHCLKKISDIIMNKDYKSIKSAYGSVCGLYSDKTDKFWIIDIDDVNYDASSLVRYIDTIQPVERMSKLLAKIPTKNGYHLIVRPFNTKNWFNDGYLFDIHKNNPTILYMP